MCKSKKSKGLFAQMEDRVEEQGGVYDTSDLQAIIDYWDSIKLPKNTCV